jgi:Peptidase family M28
VLNGRIYRAAFLPLLFALVIAGFSLTGRTAPLSSNLAPEAFEGARAFATLQGLARQFPERRPGSAGDQQLAAHVAQTLRGLGSAAKGGFAVSTRAVSAPTIEGRRTLTTVIAQRPGTTGEAPIVILAHRDAAGRGAEAELSGTAALLELARVLAAGETQRTIVLVSTSGGSGGNGGAADFAAHAGELVGMAGGGGAGGSGAGSSGAAVDGEGGPSRPIDAALVLGDLAGTRASGPEVASFSASPGSAPALLQRTVAAAVAQQAGGMTGAPGTLATLAHLVFPLAGGEQGPLGARGLPAVLVGAGGELPPAAGEPVRAARLEALGRGVLAAVYALDGGPEIGGSEASRGLETGLPIQQKAIPAWALRLVVAALLLPALAVLGDGLARMRRRRVPVGRWVAWALACALPFLACAAFTMLLGSLGAIPAPHPPVSEAALPLDSHALEAVLASALVLVLAWLAWPALMRRIGLPVHPHDATARRSPPRGHTDAAALGMLLVLGGLTVVVWVSDPLTALLLLPALNLWLVLAAARPGWSAGGRGDGWGRLQALALVALGVVPLVLLVAFYAHHLDLGLAGVVHTALLLLAGGRIGLAGAVLWSVACGCLAAALLLALAPREVGSDDPGEPPGWPEDRETIKLRGPLSYAGPGSLGGTESALRR